MAFFLRSPREPPSSASSSKEEKEERKVLNPVGPLMRSPSDTPKNVAFNGKPIRFYAPPGATSSAILSVDPRDPTNSKKKHGRNHKKSDHTRRNSISHGAPLRSGTELDVIRPSASVQDISKFTVEDFNYLSGLQPPASASSSFNLAHRISTPYSSNSQPNSARSSASLSPTQKGELHSLKAEKEELIRQLAKQRQEKQKAMEQLWRFWDKNAQLEQQLEEVQQRFDESLRKSSTQPSSNSSNRSNDEIRRLANFYGAWSNKSGESIRATIDSDLTSTSVISTTTSTPIPTPTETPITTTAATTAATTNTTTTPVEKTSHLLQDSLADRILEGEEQRQVQEKKKSNMNFPLGPVHGAAGKSNTNFRELLSHWNQKSTTTLTGVTKEEQEINNPEVANLISPRRARNTSITDQFRQEKAKQFQQLEDKVNELEQHLKTAKRRLHLQQLDRERSIRKITDITDNLQQLRHTLPTISGLLLVESIQSLERLVGEMAATGLSTLNSATLNTPPISPSPSIPSISPSSLPGSLVGGYPSGLLRQRTKPKDRSPGGVLKRAGSVSFTGPSAGSRTSVKLKSVDGNSRLVSSLSSVTGADDLANASPSGDVFDVDEDDKLSSRRRSFSDPTKHSWEYPTRPILLFRGLENESGSNLSSLVLRGENTKPSSSLGQISISASVTPPSDSENQMKKSEERLLQSPQPSLSAPHRERRNSQVARAKGNGASGSSVTQIPILLLSQKEPSIELLNGLLKDYEQSSTSSSIPLDSPLSSSVGSGGYIMSGGSSVGGVKPRRRELSFGLTEAGKPVLLAGSKVGIVEWLVEKNTDVRNLHVFLATFRTYLKPIDLLKQLSTFFSSLPSTPSSPTSEFSSPSPSPPPHEIDQRISRRAVFVLKEWLAQYFSLDIKSETDLVENLNVLLTEIMPQSGFLELSLELRVLIQTNEEHSKYRASGGQGDTPKKKGFRTPRGFTNPVTGRIDFLSVSADDAAKQLTLMEHEMFRTIAPHECIRKDTATSPSIEAFIKRFNHVSYWVATEVVMTPNIKQRVAVLKRFITIARKCLEMNNFNTLLEITSGLNSADVQRLKSTWRSLPSKYIIYFEELEDVMAPQRNFRTYRDALKTSFPPVLPYFGIYLRDMTFIDEGNPDYVNGDLINFEKLNLISGVLREVEAFQNVKYDIQPIPVLQNYFKNLVMLPEATRYQYSKLCEPRAEEVGW